MGMQDDFSLIHREIFALFCFLISRISLECQVDHSCEIRERRVVLFSWKKSRGRRFNKDRNGRCTYLTILISSCTLLKAYKIKRNSHSLELLLTTLVIRYCTERITLARELKVPISLEVRMAMDATSVSSIVLLNLYLGIPGHPSWYCSCSSSFQLKPLLYRRMYDTSYMMDFC